MPLKKVTHIRFMIQGTLYKESHVTFFIKDSQLGNPPSNPWRQLHQVDGKIIELSMVDFPAMSQP